MSSPISYHRILERRVAREDLLDWDLRSSLYSTVGHKAVHCCSYSRVMKRDEAKRFVRAKATRKSPMLAVSSERSIPCRLVASPFVFQRVNLRNKGFLFFGIVTRTIRQLPLRFCRIPFLQGPQIIVNEVECVSDRCGCSAAHERIPFGPQTEWLPCSLLAINGFLVCVEIGVLKKV